MQPTGTDSFWGEGDQEIGYNTEGQQAYPHPSTLLSPVGRHVLASAEQHNVQACGDNCQIPSELSWIQASRILVGFVH